MTMHRACRYTGKGALKANAGKQLVALDVEFRDFDSGLDLDDVDIVDALSGRALQSAPEIAFLRSDGSFYAWRKAQPNGPMRPR